MAPLDVRNLFPDDAVPLLLMNVSVLVLLTLAIVYLYSTPDAGAVNPSISLISISACPFVLTVNKAV